jgi:hypothetical protein
MMGVKEPGQVWEFLAKRKELNGHDKVTLIAGCNSTDL